MRLSKNFDSSEFACHCGCGFGDTHGVVDSRLVEGLQQLRDNLGCAIHINSPGRCTKHNASVGGAKKSQHLLLRATDVRSENHTPEEVAREAEKIEWFRIGGIGIYNGFTHLDSRVDGPARWDKRT